MPRWIRGGRNVFDRLNSELSIGARLTLVSALFIGSTAIGAGLVLKAGMDDVGFSNKELAGTEHLALVWQAVEAPHGQASSILGTEAKEDERFGSADEREAFVAATSDRDQIAAASAYIVAIGDGSNLTLDPDLDSFYAMDAIVVRLPNVVLDMHTLQAAISSAAEPAQKGRDIAVAADRLERSRDQALASMSAAVANNKNGLLDGKLSAPSTALKSATDAMLAAARRAIDTGDAGTVGAQGVETAANAAWHASQEGLESLLKARIAGLEGILFAELAFAVLSALLAALMSLLVGRGLSGRLSSLLGVMDNLRESNAAVTVPYQSDRHETGKIAATLELFRKRIIEREAEQRQVEADKLQADRAQREAEEAALSRERATVVGSLGEGLSALAAGDLTYRLNHDMPVAYERLQSDFNAAMTQLQDLMKAVAANVTGIRSGAGEIGQAADDLSRRTEQQAAAIEETAAALDEITATVRKSADSASRANSVVSSARTDAETSGNVVREAVSAMGEIERSASQISQIIGVIDEIAFQTNLLALNAGVEAARAGDAGRGFAVVASEVRALAQRSSDAAKEIKALISASANHVGSGVKLVGKTGEALQDIIGRVTEINDLVSEIAASAKEQSTALQEVNTAVNQMDQVTQQNAAMVEESTAASHALTQEAAELTRLLSAFQVGAADIPRATRAPAKSRPMPPVVVQQKRVAAFAASQSAAAQRVSAPDDWEEF
jgi:methyl-accepting chemotaxis protein